MKRCLGLFSEEPNTSSNDRFPLSLPHLELLELSHQPGATSAPPSKVKKGSGRQMETGQHRARAGLGVRQGTALPSGVKATGAMGVKAPELPCMHPRRMSLDIFKCQEIATGSYYARITVLVVRSEGGSVS